MIWISLILMIALDVWYHYWMIEKKGIRPYHGVSGLYRIIGVYMIHQMFDGNPDLLPKIMWMFTGFFAYWLLFNLGLNGARNKPIGYVGKKSLLDKLEAMSPSVVFNLFAKAVLLAGCVQGYLRPELLSASYWD